MFIKFLFNLFISQFFYILGLYHLSIEPEKPVVAGSYLIKINGSTISLVFTKQKEDVHWSQLGRTTKESMTSPTSSNFPYQSFRVVSNTKISHDAHMIVLGPVIETFLAYIPAGHHIDIRTTIEGEAIIRPYTPIPSFDQNCFIAKGIKKV